MGRGAQTWRMLRLTRWATQPCKYCGQEHEYLARPTRGQTCQPVIFPPGMHAGGAQGVEGEVFNVGPMELPGMEDHDTAYQLVSRRVAEMAIRCERCGAHFTDLGA